MSISSAINPAATYVPSPAAQDTITIGGGRITVSEHSQEEINQAFIDVFTEQFLDVMSNEKLSWGKAWSQAGDLFVNVKDTKISDVSDQDVLDMFAEKRVFDGLFETLINDPLLQDKHVKICLFADFLEKRGLQTPFSRVCIAAAHEHYKSREKLSSYVYLKPSAHVYFKFSEKGAEWRLSSLKVHCCGKDEPTGEQELQKRFTAYSKDPTKDEIVDFLKPLYQNIMGFPMQDAPGKEKESKGKSVSFNIVDIDKKV